MFKLKIGIEVKLFLDLFLIIWIYFCFLHDVAQRIAQANDKALLNDVLIGQAKQSFDNNDFPKAESYLLQAQRPDLAVKLYKDNGIIINTYILSFEITIFSFC
jgi:intraflagellar transport protein 172